MELDHASMLWLTVTFAWVLAFGLGVFLGRIYERLSSIPLGGYAQGSGQGAGRNSQSSEWKNLQAGDCEVESWLLKENELVFYVTKGGERVHLYNQCSGFNGARSPIQTKTLCDHCRRKGFPGVSKTARKRVIG